MMHPIRVHGPGGGVNATAFEVAGGKEDEWEEGSGGVWGRPGCVGYGGRKPTWYEWVFEGASVRSCGGSTGRFGVWLLIFLAMVISVMACMVCWTGCYGCLWICRDWRRQVGLLPVPTHQTLSVFPIHNRLDDCFT